MNWLIQRGGIMWLIMMGLPWSTFGSADCEPCEEPNDPTLVAGGAPPCIPLVEGSTVAGEPCKECDGEGGIRHKGNGTEVDVDGVAGRCCGGAWYAIDSAKEESECWEWDNLTCEYVCSDVQGPKISVEEITTVDLECPWSTEPLPTLSATGLDYCENTVAVAQSPAGGGGAYGNGESVTVTLTAHDECGRSSTREMLISFEYECDSAALRKERDELISLINRFIAECHSGEEIVDELRIVYRKIQEIQKSYHPDYTQPEAGGMAGLQIGLLLVKLIGEMDELCQNFKSLCSELSSLNEEIQNTYAEYLYAYYSIECYSRCYRPLPGPPQFRCPICVLAPHCN